MGADAALKDGGQEAGGGGQGLVSGTVLEELPSALYRVELDGRQVVLAHVAGTVKRNFVRLLPGDRVRVELSPRDFTRGRIIRKETGPRPAGSGI